MSHKFEFSQRAFFKLGFVCFSIIAIANMAGLYIDFSLLPIWAIIARAGNIIFNIGLAYLFYWLNKTTPDKPQDPYYSMSDEELKEFLKGKKEVKK